MQFWIPLETTNVHERPLCTGTAHSAFTRKAVPLDLQLFQRQVIHFFISEHIIDGENVKFYLHLKNRQSSCNT